MNLLDAQRAVFASALGPNEKLVALALLNHWSRARDTFPGVIDRSEWPGLTAGAARLAKLPLSLRYCPGATLPLLRSTVRTERNRLRARGIELGLVALDYLQIMGGARERGQTRSEFIGGLMRGLLQLAAEFEVPVVVASQLNRGLEARTNKNRRPSLADLRESGDIEQDAYSVTLLYRRDYYDRETRHRGIMEADVQKTRGGAAGRSLLRFTPEYSRVDDIAEEPRDYEWDDVGDAGM